MISWIFYHSINKGNPRLSYILLIYWLLKGTLYSSLFNATLLSYHCIYLGFNTIVLAEEIVMCYDQQPNVVLFVHVFNKYINIVVDTRLKADRGIHIPATFNATLLVF